MKKSLASFSSLVIFSLLAQCFFPLIEVHAAAPATPEPGVLLKELKDSLLMAPNHLEYTAYQMLRYKYPELVKKLSPDQDDYYRDYALQPRGASALSYELAGSLGGSAGLGQGSGLSEGINLLTGNRAIDESLQLGSIGTDRSVMNQGGASPLVATTSINEIVPLELKPHPWATMMKTQPTIPAMFNLIPADDFMVYFNNADKFSELDKILNRGVKPFEQVYGLKDAAGFKAKMFKQLGVKDIPILTQVVDEVAFVSEDFDFSVGTDFALILKLKSALGNSFVSQYVTAPADRHGQVGDYYVVATNPGLFNRIKDLPADKSVAKAPDLAYTLSVLETNYDGFAFISEALVGKLTSPTYRLNARRRNTVLQAVQSLQYGVFAYRTITHRWPTSLNQLVAEKYVAPKTVANMEDYTVDAKGVVHHKLWGSAYKVTPVNQVPITNIYPVEKNIYEAFREGYQRFWREFIDPVGVAILVGDQVRFHTIILPLIDESQYNYLKTASGKEPVPLNFINQPDRISAIQAVAKLDVDSILTSIGKTMGKQFDEAYRKCVNNYYSGNFDANRPSLADTCKYVEPDDAAAIKLVKEKLAESIGWKESEDVLGFIGNEVTVGAGDNIQFKLNDFNQFDVFAALSLKDTVTAQKFIEHVFKTVTDQSGNNRGGFGFFSIEVSEPIKNNYQGKDFYTLPLGVTNIHYIFLNNRIYLTASQAAINRLIDSASGEKVVWGDDMNRLFDYLGDKHNAVLFADTNKMQGWIKGGLKSQLESYGVKSDFQRQVGYYQEALSLAKSLDGYDGTASISGDYYHFIPTKWFDAELSSKNGSVYLTTAGKEYNVRDLDFGSYGYRLPTVEDGTNGQNQVVKTKLTDLTKNFDIEKAFNEWLAIKDFGVSLSFTDDGLDIKVVFSNPEQTEIDSRVPAGQTRESSREWPRVLMMGIGAGIVILLLLIIVVIVWRRRRRPADIVVPPTLPVPPVTPGVAPGDPFMK